MRQSLPYGRSWIDEEDIQSVVQVLRGDWLTTGPKVNDFERAFADYTGVKEAVAVANGTAALHAAMYAIGVGIGDEVIVSSMTFAATANCVVFQGATPVFADVLPGSLLIDPEDVERKITAKTRAIIAVDYAGQPCQYGQLRELCQRHRLVLVADACHSLGASYKGKGSGALADLSTFSFHPVKPLTCGEGGMVTTESSEWAERMRTFRNHGITKDHRQRDQAGIWFYEMVDLGFNYRLTDIQCALGISQLKKLPQWVCRRESIARRYDASFADCAGICPLSLLPDRTHAYHLYVVCVDQRDRLFTELRSKNIGVQVHYIPVHLHPYYRNRFQTQPGLCPHAEFAFQRVLSLPIFPAMTDVEVDYVANVLKEAVFQKGIQ